MTKIQPTTTITVDGKVYAVSELPQDTQSMIAHMDHWRQKEAEVVSDLLMVRGAIQNIQQQLVHVLQSHNTDTKE